MLASLVTSLPSEVLSSRRMSALHRGDFSRRRKENKEKRELAGSIHMMISAAILNAVMEVFLLFFPFGLFFFLWLTASHRNDRSEFYCPSALIVIQCVCG